MKIGIIGDSDGFGAALAAELAKRYLPEKIDVVVLRADEVHAPEAITLAQIQQLDLLFETRPEPVVIPLVMREVIPWPEEPKAHKPRYNRKPKWRQNGSGSKYFSLHRPGESRAFSFLL